MLLKFLQPLTLLPTVPPILYDPHPISSLVADIAVFVAVTALRSYFTRFSVNDFAISVVSVSQLYAVKGLEGDMKQPERDRKGEEEDDRKVSTKVPNIFMTRATYIIH